MNEKITMTDRKFLERYMVHLKNTGYMPKDAREISY